MEVVGTLVRLIWELVVYLVTVLPDLLSILARRHSTTCSPRRSWRTCPRARP